MVGVGAFESRTYSRKRFLETAFPRNSAVVLG